MNNVKIKYDQLLFLFVYLRQLDLSLDRSRWTSWTELQAYYKNVIPPSKVIQYLKVSFHLPDTKLTPVTIVPEKKIMDIIATMLKARVFKRYQLRQDEILYCYNLLLTFDDVLNSDIEIYNIEIEKLRIGVATYGSDVLGWMMSYQDLNKLMSVEHYLQNEIITSAIEVNKFIPKDFFVK
ncbi:hypothetical protein [Pedobacter sp. KBW06]|uniref:hypothetical protein n=1 Tax=Pedobacter sp. KBW06 TaxID=2153359 RepID=UPI000F5930CF|nr:hypothetical protein [Pedobacter sp. KBW06]